MIISRLNKIIKTSSSGAPRFWITPKGDILNVPDDSVHEEVFIQKVLKKKLETIPLNLRESINEKAIKNGYARVTGYGFNDDLSVHLGVHHPSDVDRFLKFIPSKFEHPKTFAVSTLSPKQLIGPYHLDTEEFESIKDAWSNMMRRSDMIKTFTRNYKHIIAFLGKHPLNKYEQDKSKYVIMSPYADMGEDASLFWNIESLEWDYFTNATIFDSLSEAEAATPEVDDEYQITDLKEAIEIYLKEYKEFCEREGISEQEYKENAAPYLEQLKSL